MTKKRLLITGGSGFIGTNAVSYFGKEFDILNLDINKPKIESQKVSWRNVDIRNFKELKTIVQDFNPNYILHLAARTDLDGKSLDDYSSNTIGVKNIVEVAKQLSQLEKIIITSSMLVCHVGYMPKDQHDYSATTLYGKSKIETEKITWDANLQCDWAIIRPTSIWGPWFDIPYRSFFNMVKRHEYVHIGHKGCTKTYGYIGNSIYQIEKILKTDTSKNQVKTFYIGDNPPINITEWANQIGKELGIKIPTMPWAIIKLAAYFGDILKMVGIRFPLTSFRIKNMTTDNIMDLSQTYEIAPKPPYNRTDGIRATLKWMENH